MKIANGGLLAGIFWRIGVDLAILYKCIHISQGFVGGISGQGLIKRPLIWREAKMKWLRVSQTRPSLGSFLEPASLVACYSLGTMTSHHSRMTSDK